MGAMTTPKTNLAIPAVTEENSSHAVAIDRIHKELYALPAEVKGDTPITMLEYLMLRKGDVKTKDMAEPSNQGVVLGRKGQPFNMRGMAEFQSSNPHHSACIQTKKYSTVGLGFRQPGEDPATGGTITNAQMQQTTLTQNKFTPATNPDGTPNDKAIDPNATSAVIAQRQVLTKADKILNPLTSHTFRDVLLLVSEDYHQVGNGYIEVVRAAGDGKITGLHHIPAADVFPWIENYHYDFHYEILGEEGAGGSRHFARWGDTASFLKRNGGIYSTAWFGVPAEQLNPQMISEVISFKNPSSRNRWYGFPDWLSCVSSIELLQCLQQYMYDFFLNRGVPEFIFIIAGAKMLAADWTKVENSLKGNIGQGNSHKSVVLNLPNKDLTITLEKLAMEQGGEGVDFSAKKDCLALDIVSAHRVPPLLAGIQIPGKLGANNELPNALMAFQVLVIGPIQSKFQQTLGMTLGNPDQNGGLDLTEDDFLFRTITEQIDVGTLDTQSRMRTPVVQAQAQGRDISAGLKS